MVDACTVEGVKAKRTYRSFLDSSPDPRLSLLARLVLPIPVTPWGARSCETQLLLLELADHPSEVVVLPCSPGDEDGVLHDRAESAAVLLLLGTFVCV